MSNKFHIEINSLGEFRMDTVAYGVIVECEAGRFDALIHTKVYVATGGNKPKIDSDESTDGRYLILIGYFDTFVLDLEEFELSLFRTTVRSRDGIWSEETPILGSSTRHINAKSNDHYYIQFPFVPDEEFSEVWEEYSKRRIIQIREFKVNQTGT